MKIVRLRTGLHVTDGAIFMSTVVDLVPMRNGQVLREVSHYFLVPNDYRAPFEQETDETGVGTSFRRDPSGPTVTESQSRTRHA